MRLSWLREGSTWPRDGSKVAQDGSGCCQDGPRWLQDRIVSVPFGLWVGFRWFRNGPRWPQDGLKMASRGPKMAPRRPKMAPRWPQDGPRRPSRSFQGRFRDLSCCKKSFLSAFPFPFEWGGIRFGRAGFSRSARPPCSRSAGSIITSTHERKTGQVAIPVTVKVCCKYDQN